MHRAELRRGVFLGLSFVITAFIAGRTASEWSQRGAGLHYLFGTDFVRRCFELLLIECFLALAILQAECRALLRNFFSRPVPALNLACARVLVFAVWLSELDRSSILQLAAMPELLRESTRGTQWLVESFAFLPGQAAFAYYLWQGSCLLAIAGAFTRTAGWLSVLSGFYLHTLLRITSGVAVPDVMPLLALVFAVCGGGAAFSADAVIAAFAGRRDSEHGAAQPTDAGERIQSREAGFALASLWIILAASYFYRASVLLLSGGLASLSSIEQINQWQWNWFAGGGVVPLLRIDLWPSAASAIAAAGLAAGLLFPLALFSALLRTFVAAANAFLGFLRAAFGTALGIYLEKCTLCFFDWSAQFARFGRFAWRAPMYMVYDGNSLLCRRTRSLVEKVDIFSTIQFHDIRRGLPSFLTSVKLPSLDGEAAIVYRQKVYRSPNLPASLFIRLPLTWLVSPLFCFARVKSAIVPGPAGPTPAAPRGRGTHPRFTARLPQQKRVLIAAAVLTGVTIVASAVPRSPLSNIVSATPRDKRAPEETRRDIFQDISITGYCSDGRYQQVDLSPLREQLQPLHYSAIMRRLLMLQGGAIADARRYEAFWKWASPLLKLDCEFRSVQIFADRHSVVPELAGFNPVERVLMHEF